MFACIAVVDEVNDLGVVVDSRLTFHTHIRNNIVRASVRANLIHKCFISRDDSWSWQRGNASVATRFVIHLKIVFNLVSEAANYMITLANTLYSTRTQGHPFKLYLRKLYFIDVRKHFFCELNAITWKNLPASSERFYSFSSFKCFINSVDLTSHISLGF